MFKAFRCQRLKETDAVDDRRFKKKKNKYASARYNLGNTFVVAMVSLSILLEFSIVESFLKLNDLFCYFVYEEKHPFFYRLENFKSENFDMI
jgi:hypothetical protein